MRCQSITDMRSPWKNYLPFCNASDEKKFFCAARNYAHRKKTTLWQQDVTLPHVGTTAVAKSTQRPHQCGHAENLRFVAGTLSIFLWSGTACSYQRRGRGDDSKVRKLAALWVEQPASGIQNSTLNPKAMTTQNALRPMNSSRIRGGRAEEQDERTSLRPKKNSGRCTV